MGVSEIASNIFDVINDNPGICASQIASLLNVSRSQVTRTLPNMQKHGYLLSEYKNRLFIFRNLHKKEQKMKLNQDTVEKTISVIRSYINTATIKVKRSPADFWADRLRIASSESSLLSALDYFGRQLGAASLDGDEYKNLLLASKAPDSWAVLQWISELPRVAIGLAQEQNKKDLPMLIEAICESYVVKEIILGTQKARPNFDIAIKATILQALTHGADTKAGNATLFRRAKVYGGLNLPYYSANAIGGMMRDYLADHFTESLGFKVSRSASPIWDDWFFHLLYSGGIMQDGYIPKEFERTLTGAATGTIRSDGVRQLREMLPFFSMLGGVGKHPIESYISINDLRPNCIEWGTGDQSINAMFDWRYLARRDDNENRTSKAQKESGEVSEGSENTSMLANTEVLREGVVLEGGFFLSNHINDLEKAAFCKGLELIQKMPFLGGKKNRSFGLCEIEYFIHKKGFTLDALPYDDYLAKNKDIIIAYLGEIGAFAKPEKAKKEKQVEMDIL